MFIRQRVTMQLICKLTDNIRIYPEWEGGIEKSVARITVWNQEACRVMTAMNMKDRFFYSILTQITDSFSCSPLTFLF